jgi:hypothetical protein
MQRLIGEDQNSTFPLVQLSGAKIDFKRSEPYTIRQGSFHAISRVRKVYYAWALGKKTNAELRTDYFGVT